MANSDLIQMSKEEMTTMSKKFRTEEDKLNTIIKNMSGLMKTLQTQWKGKAQEKFSTEYLECEKDFKKAEKIIESIAKALDESANLMANFDKELASKMGRR